MVKPAVGKLYAICVGEKYFGDCSNLPLPENRLVNIRSLANYDRLKNAKRKYFRLQLPDTPYENQDAFCLHPMNALCLLLSLFIPLNIACFSYSYKCSTFQLPNTNRNTKCHRFVLSFFWCKWPAKKHGWLKLQLHQVKCPDKKEICSNLAILVQTAFRYGAHCIHSVGEFLWLKIRIEFHLQKFIWKTLHLAHWNSFNRYKWGCALLPIRSCSYMNRTHFSWRRNILRLPSTMDM